jgi:hypothetical protein
MAKGDVQRLAQEIRKCHGDAACQKAAEDAFAAKADTTVEGGKVFTDDQGDTIFVTNGGKVFGGKVF